MKIDFASLNLYWVPIYENNTMLFRYKIYTDGILNSLVQHQK